MGKRVSDLVGEQIARARHRRNWTQQRLAEAVRQHDPDSKIGRAAIAKIESGVRGASIDELLLIAAALNVPPVLLMVPLGSEDTVALTPRSDIHPHLAMDWMCGDEALVTSQQTVIDRGGWLSGAEPLRLYRKLRATQDELRATEAAVRRSEAIGDQAQLLHDRKARAEVLESFHAHLRTMQAAGVQPPTQTKRQLEEMEAVGLDVEGFRVWERTDEEGVG